MRSSILFLIFFIISTISLAQSYSEYCIQGTNDQTVLAQYVGEKVKVLKSVWSKDITVGQKVVLDRDYIIEDIKVGKQIVFYLRDDLWGNKVKIKLHSGFYCQMFFLTEKFKELENNLLGKRIKNEEKQEVATIVSVDMSTENDYPHILYSVKSDFAENIFKCDPSEVYSLCKKIGTTVSNFGVKASYQILGVEDKDSIGHSYSDDIHYRVHNYILKNTLTNELKKYEAKKIDHIFDEDLSGHYISVLTKVEKPSNPTIRYGKTTIIEGGDRMSKYNYVDNIIDILIFGSYNKFDFILKNISNSSIKVIWNEAAFVDYNGNSSKIMHVGTKYSQREADQPSTTIISGAKIEDLAAPNCNVRYSEALKEWVTDSMYPIKPGLNPGKIKLMLPIQIKDVINEYVFVFDVRFVYNHPDRLLIK